MIVRIPTAYHQHRTNTGRLSSGLDTSDLEKSRGRKKQQLQNVPKSLRDMFNAPAGMIFVGGDWTAIEWAHFMWYGAKVNDPPGYHRSLLDRFRLGKSHPAYLDPHVLLARTYTGREQITKAERQTVKPYTYGLLFKGSPAGVADSVGHNRNTGEAIAAAHRAAFKTEPVWHWIVSEAKRKKYVQTPLGFRRYFWGWDAKETEIIGTLIQGTAADLCKWVLLDTANKLPKGWEIITTTHDSIILMVPFQQIQEAESFLRYQMTQSIPFLGGEQWAAEIKIGTNWKMVS